MGVTRVVGIETEYGVVSPGNPGANPILMSSQVVNAYRALAELPRPPRWDYLDEDPLADARGFHLQRASAHPSLLTDDPSRPAPSGDVPTGDADAGDFVVAGPVTGIARPAAPLYDDPSTSNAILTNGARLYVDHAHPEYSAPEVLTPREAVVWDVAGERVMLRAARELASAGIDVDLYKNNGDGKGASYGTHENFLVDRGVPFETLVDLLTPFLVTRQVIVGSGRVGLGQRGEDAGFQMSQRADFMEAEVGLETTLRRPIVNTRDEPHADRERWRRLHVIIGDANLLETATFLKIGMTNLVLAVAENLHRLGPATARLVGLRLADPVGDVRGVSRDLDLAAPLYVRGGGTVTALEVQGLYLDAAREVAALDGTPDAPTQEVLDRWEDVLVRLGRSLAECARDVEWVAKHRLLDRMREREGLGWASPRLAAFDLQWSDVRPERGVYQRLLAAGAVDRLTTEAEVADAVHHPPVSTRAYFRGEVVARFGPHLDAASWDSVVLDVPGAPALQRVPMLDPHKGTRAQVGPLFDAHGDDVGAFLAALLA
ncbi:depupylase/deamidase Dop [Sanguibacter sp. HDW7]|uniref:depupylase/deamidase Dop n=1 Tax=Sanguibacter sp. HDW7 TaxID=2714931 RepID=UPI00140D87CF|nr:depupylase/deamidase Dop [Sanguibacter sp. HDW7]QIK83429.1 proteasome accessory factor PafA2 [Sanguibacter sp. HDW7]